MPPNVFWWAVLHYCGKPKKKKCLLVRELFVTSSKSPRIVSISDSLIAFLSPPVPLEESFLSIFRLRQSACLLLDRSDLFLTVLQALVFLQVFSRSRQPMTEQLVQTAPKGGQSCPQPGRTRLSIAPVLAKLPFLFLLLLCVIVAYLEYLHCCVLSPHPPPQRIPPECSKEGLPLPSHDLSPGSFLL